MRVRMLSPEFVPLVQLPDDAPRAKRQTIRPNPWTVGEQYELRSWSGKAYRSTQVRHGLVVECTGVEHVHIGECVILDACGLCVLEFVEDLNAFAVADGFRDWPAMHAWFAARYTLPFGGWVNYFRVVQKNA